MRFYLTQPNPEKPVTITPQRNQCEGRLVHFVVWAPGFCLVDILYYR